MSGICFRILLLGQLRDFKRNKSDEPNTKFQGVFIKNIYLYDDHDSIFYANAHNWIILIVDEYNKLFNLNKSFSKKSFFLVLTREEKEYEKLLMLLFYIVLMLCGF